MEDQKIVALFWSRSEDAITEAVSKYGSLCHYIANNILRDPQDAEECVNDAYTALWNTIPPERPTCLSAYLTKVTRNIAMKRIRYRSAQKRADRLTLSLQELEECIPDRNTPEQTVSEKALAKAVEVFLQSEDVESRNMFLRRYWFFDSISEIAQRFGVSESKVKVRLLRVRNRLKQHLIKEEWIYDR